MFRFLMLFLVFGFLQFNINDIKALEASEESFIVEEVTVSENDIIIEEDDNLDGEDGTDEVVEEGEVEPGSNDGNDTIEDGEEDKGDLNGGENGEDSKEDINLESYYLFLDLIDKLEECAKNYVAERDYQKDTLKYSKNKLVYSYIRSKRYNSSLWSYLAGSIDVNFNNYVKEKNPDIEKIKSLEYIVIPNGEKVDVVHMFASIDMHYEGLGCLGSWGGDLVQVINVLKNEKGTKEELYEKFKNSINVPGYFSNEDMNGDLDSLNLYRRIRSSKGETMKELIETYYLELTNEMRVNEFIDNKYKFKTYNNENLRKFVYDEFINDRYILLLLDYNDIYVNQHSIYINVALEVFSDYLFSIYNGKQVNNVEKEPTKDNEDNNEEKNEEPNIDIGNENNENIEDEKEEPIVNDDIINNNINSEAIEDVITYNKEESLEEITIEETTIKEIIIEEETYIEESIIKEESIVSETNEEIESEVIMEEEVPLTGEIQETKDFKVILIVGAIILSILIFLILNIYLEKEDSLE